ncbi:hypothetical protein PANA5342_2371 [Pantoea ananatis LMG 5342]|nr:hypothetical protein PANA5342_2371 [Pantoea ananatis LMG 5342]
MAAFFMPMPGGCAAAGKFIQRPSRNFAQFIST